MSFAIPIDLADSFKLDKPEGALASTVEKGGPADKAGLQAGDVLLAVNGQTVRSVDQVRAALAKSDKSVALLIQRGEDKIFIPVRIG